MYFHFCILCLRPQPHWKQSKRERSERPEQPYVRKVLIAIVCFAPSVAVYNCCNDDFIFAAKRFARKCLEKLAVWLRPNRHASSFDRHRNLSNPFNQFIDKNGRLRHLFIAQVNKFSRREPFHHIITKITTFIIYCIYCQYPLFLQVF